MFARRKERRAILQEIKQLDHDRKRRIHESINALALYLTDPKEYFDQWKAWKEANVDISKQLNEINRLRMLLTQ